MVARDQQYAYVYLYVLCAHVFILGGNIARGGHHFSCQYCYFSLRNEPTTMAEEKINEILESLKTLKKSQDDGQNVIKRRLDQLEMDVAAGQENATQCVVKKLKEDQTFVFRKKGNEKQYIFNDNVKDQIVATARQLELVNLPEGSQREAIDKAKEELKQGLDMIAARQKRIKVTDCSEYG